MSNTLEQEITVSSILKFVLPSVIMMVFMSLYTVVDGTFVSRLIGTDAFSAVNVVYPLVSVTIGFGTMFGTGVTAIVSRKLGEGKRQEANQIFTFIVLLTAAVGILISAVCFIFLKSILYGMGSNEEIFGYCYAYAFPLIFFFPANILQLLFQSLYVADGKPQIGLIVTALGGIANVGLDYIFIAGFHMGISGAAAATGIGYLIPAVYGLFYFTVHRRGNLCFVKPKADWRALFYTVTNGSSEMISCLSTSVTTFLFNIIMMKLVGQDGVAAIAILLYLDFVLIAVSLGYSMGVAPLFGYNYGCGNHRKLRKLYQLSIGFCAVFGLTMTAGSVIFSSQLISVFTARESSVYEMAAAGLVIYAFSYLFKGFSVFSSSMFTAFGNGRVSAVLSFLRTFIFLTGSLLGLSAVFGVPGVWYASPLAEMLAFVFSVYFCFKYRKQYHYGKKQDKSFCNSCS